MLNLGFWSVYFIIFSCIMIVVSLYRKVKKYTWKVERVNGLYYVKFSKSYYLDSKTHKLQTFQYAEGYNTFDEACKAIKIYGEQYE